MAASVNKKRRFGFKISRPCARKVTRRRRYITKLQVYSFVRNISISIDLHVHVLLFLVPDRDQLLE